MQGSGSAATVDWKQVARLVLVCACVMAMGWGIRGSYGHTTGARMPGALIGLAIAVCMLGDNAWRRAPVLGMLGAVGWAFGGQSSYGILIGYTVGGTWTNSLYGYCSLFIVGSVWGGIGAGILSLGFTKSRAYLSEFILPMTATYIVWVILAQTGYIEQWMGGYESDTWLFDSYWVEALAAGAVALLFHAVSPRTRNATTLMLLIVAGWFGGMFILANVLGLRINPPRNDSWAGCVGVLVTLFVYFARQKDRTALTLLAYGFVGGGLGFAIGDFFQMLGRGKWGPIANSSVLQELNYWTIMEQSFGFIMAVGVAFGVVQVLRRSPLPDIQKETNDWLNVFSISVIFGPVLWDNLKLNVPEWIEAGKVPGTVLGLSAGMMMFVMVVLIYLVALYGLILYRTGRLEVGAPPLARAQFLLIAFIGAVLTMQFSTETIQAPNMVMFVVASLIAVVLVLRIQSSKHELVPGANPGAAITGSGLKLAAVAAPLIVMLLAWLTMGMDMEQTQYRFK